MKQVALILIYFSIILVQTTSALAEVDCSEFTTNTTCLLQGCNCAYLVCDTDSACVPANATHSQPVNVDKCQSYEFCFECSHNSDSRGEARCSAGYSSTTVAHWKIAVIVLSAAFFVFIVISLVLYLKMRNKKNLPKTKEVTMEYNEMK